MNTRKNSNTAQIAVIGSIVVAVILVLGSLWMGQRARQDTEDAVRAVSLLYLDELAGRREKVVENNLRDKIRDMRVAISLIEEGDMQDEEHLMAYQNRIRQLYNIDKFAFVDADGLIHTADGIRNNIDEYDFDYRKLTEPEISVLALDTKDKKAVIAIPADLVFEGKQIVACFEEIDMPELLAGASIESGNGDTTFCNIYTTSGVALSNTVLGGLAVEDNLLDAMSHAVYENGYSYEGFLAAFTGDERGEVSFIYEGIRESLSFVPVAGTNWRLTYLIRENVITERIGSVSSGILSRSIIQSILTVAAMVTMFLLIISQTKKNAALQIEKEKTEAKNRVKQEEMAEKLALQERLLAEEKRRSQQDSMITAMATDYRSVYHVNLDTDDAVCYRGDPADTDQHAEGVHFSYYEAFRGYGERFVAEPYREGFLAFIDPDNIRAGLEKERILAYRYLVRRKGLEYYEMIRVAGVRHAEDRNDCRVHAVGLGLTVIDAEMRKTLAQQQALSDALAAAEQASRAKTSFLSSMSHEIRTPMNAIIGLDNIALNDPDISPKTREHLEKIGASAEHLLGLINDILDMSRIESGRMTLKNEEFSFRKLLAAINTMFASQCQDKGLHYQCRMKSEVDDCYIGDGMKLRQVLINILGNAVKFTPEGGSVTFDVERKARFDGKTALVFTVTDTGIGMSEDFLPHIFDTFAQEDASNTSRYGSSGLGMAITKSIVEMMNGKIEVKSVKGEGSTFTVTVTLADAPCYGDDEEELHLDHMSVLVVDDDPVACEHARLVLEKAGVAAESCESGAEAIEMVKLRNARRKPYNLILVDWKMPDMDGVETTRRIREIIGNETAIIILTAYRWDDVLDEAKQAGVDSFLPKPLFAGAVLEEFRSASRRKSGEARKEKAKADLAGRRILLAEDVDINAEIIQMLLEVREITTERAENGRIAVEMFASHPAGYYDAILMDVRMPEMDGLTATQTIRAMDRPDASELPIIALTANAFDEDVQRSLQAGLNAHLTKPIQPEALYETLESLIR